MPARAVSIAVLSPNPLSITLAPSAASARAVASPMPEVEPVTSAVLPFSMEVPRQIGPPKGPQIRVQDEAGTLPLYLLQCNIYISRSDQLFAIWRVIGYSYRMKA